MRVITMTRGWQIPTSRIRDLVSELYSPTLSLADLEPAQQRQVIRSALLEELKGV